jgi:hypothetical protein
LDMEDILYGVVNVLMTVEEKLDVFHDSNLVALLIK